MADNGTTKTVWVGTAIPDEVHEAAKTLAFLERKQLGHLLAELLKPVLKQRTDAALKMAKLTGRLPQFKRQQRNGGRR